MDLPYDERRELLEALELERRPLAHARPRRRPRRALLAATAEQGLEGVVAKRLDSPYEPGRRSPCWMKVKNVDRQELVVGGWMPGEGRRRERIGALLVGVRRGRRAALRRPGRHGFTEAELDRLADAARAAASATRRRSTPPSSPSRRAAPCASSRASSPRSSSASGRRAACCARRRTRACATTRRPTRSSARAGRAGRCIREEKDKAVAVRSRAARSRSRTSTRSCIRRPASPSAT